MFLQLLRWVWCARQLEECNDLLSIDLQAIGMTSLSLGTCPHLTSLALNAPVLRTLDLKCAQLPTCQWPTHTVTRDHCQMQNFLLNPPLSKRGCIVKLRRTFLVFTPRKAIHPDFVLHLPSLGTWSLWHGQLCFLGCRWMSYSRDQS